jgi:hypothetical protein
MPLLHLNASFFLIAKANVLDVNGFPQTSHTCQNR